MSSYKRYYQPGGYYFFTLVTHQRKPIFLSTENIDLLKSAIKKVKDAYPFKLNALVILPDHLHILWKQPDNDDDFSTRLRLIKRDVSINLLEKINQRGEKEIWQRRFWEHAIRNVDDWQKHMDYIHYNPVKHGYVKSVKDWSHSSFSYWVKNGLYDINWGVSEPDSIAQLEVE